MHIDAAGQFQLLQRTDRCQGREWKPHLQRHQGRNGVRKMQTHRAPREMHAQDRRATRVEGQGQILDCEANLWRSHHLSSARIDVCLSLSLTHRNHVAGADNAVFQSKWVAELKKQPLFDEVPSPPIQKVIISCDPNGGGTSHMAIVSAFYYKRVMVVSMGGGGGAIA